MLGNGDGEERFGCDRIVEDKSDVIADKKDGEERDEKIQLILQCFTETNQAL